MANLNDIYTKVARTADTDGTVISAAVTSRVLACFFDQLAAMSAAEVLDVIKDGIRTAEERSELVPSGE